MPATLELFCPQRESQLTHYVSHQKGTTGGARHATPIALWQLKREEKGVAALLAYATVAANLLTTYAHDGAFSAPCRNILKPGSLSTVTQRTLTY